MIKLFEIVRSAAFSEFPGIPDIAVARDAVGGMVGGGALATMPVAAVFIRSGGGEQPPPTIFIRASVIFVGIEQAVGKWIDGNGAKVSDRRCERPVNLAAEAHGALISNHGNIALIGGFAEECSFVAALGCAVAVISIDEPQISIQVKHFGRVEDGAEVGLGAGDLGAGLGIEIVRDGDGR